MTMAFDCCSKASLGGSIRLKVQPISWIGFQLGAPQTPTGQCRLLMDLPRICSRGFIEQPRNECGFDSSIVQHWPKGSITTMPPVSSHGQLFGANSQELTPRCFADMTFRTASSFQTVPSCARKVSSPTRPE